MRRGNINYGKVQEFTLSNMFKYSREEVRSKGVVVIPFEHETILWSNPQYSLQPTLLTNKLTHLHPFSIGQARLTTKKTIVYHCLSFSHALSSCSWQ